MPKTGASNWAENGSFRESSVQYAKLSCSRVSQFMKSDGVYQELETRAIGVILVEVDEGEETSRNDDTWQQSRIL